MWSNWLCGMSPLLQNHGWSVGRHKSSPWCQYSHDISGLLPTLQVGGHWFSASQVINHLDLVERGRGKVITKGKIQTSVLAFHIDCSNPLRYRPFNSCSVTHHVVP